MRLVFRAAVVFAIVTMALLASPITAGTIIFQDDFNGHAGGDLLSSYTPPVGDSYAGEWAIIKEGGVGGTDYTGMASTMDTGQMHISAANTAAITGQKVQFNFDFYAGYGESDLITFGSGFTGRGWDLLLKGDGSIRYYNEDVTTGGGYVSAGGAGSFAGNAWVPVKVVADYGMHTFDATVGTYSFSGDWGAAGGSTFERVHMCGNGNSRFYIDNLSIQSPPAVPEPSSMALIVMGSLSLLAYAWRKRR